MKKFITILFVLFYFVLSVGITANVHICKNKVHSVQLFKYDNSFSCCKKGKMKKGCCKNIHVSFKKNSEEKITQIADFHPIQVAFKNDFVDFSFEISKPGKIDLLREDYYPPPNTSGFPRIHVVNCVFIV